ncbi:hypothetical protein [Bradyrhizobium genomosp. I (2014)]|uniref:hypothetical protein n=1 Tax=Bradyrhizobium genomosp. I (2014) TaxID=2683269 RepID=UPI0012FB0898|nr:hypothetical protein [Bradyrhizobium sp. CCBAU 43298]
MLEANVSVGIGLALWLAGESPAARQTHFGRAELARPETCVEALQRSCPDGTVAQMSCRLASSPKRAMFCAVLSVSLREIIDHLSFRLLQWQPRVDLFSLTLFFRGIWLALGRYPGQKPSCTLKVLFTTSYSRNAIIRVRLDKTQLNVKPFSFTSWRRRAPDR